jgi:RanBP1 domain
VTRRLLTRKARTSSLVMLPLHLTTRTRPRAVMPGTSITSHGGNEKAWVWTAMDFADEEAKIEMLAIRLGSVESARLRAFSLRCPMREGPSACVAAL